MGKLFDRFFLFIYSLVIGIASVFVFIAASALLPIKESEQFLQDVYYDTFTAYSLIAATIVLFILSLRFLYISVRRGTGNTPSIDQRTDYGDIRISMETVENLALKSAGRIRGIKDLKARVNVSEAGIDIAIRTIVDGESNIPELTEEVQRSVKEHVEEITGIPVAFVSVFVANVVQSHTFKSRVE